MIAIETALIRFDRFNYKYRLTNKTDENLIYKLYLKKEDTDLLIKEETIETLVTRELPVTKDGKYYIIITNYIGRENETITNIYFTHYLNLLKQIIPLVKEAICCSCGCNDDCKGCMPKEAVACLRNQSIFNLIQSYQYLIKPFSSIAPQQLNPYIFNFYQTVFDNNYLYLLCESAEQILDSQITGNPKTNKELFEYFISIFYMGFYLYDVNASSIDLIDDEEIAEDLIFINKLYDYKKLKSCVSEHLNNINELEDIFTDVINGIDPILNPFIIDSPNVIDISYPNVNSAMNADVVSLGEGTSVVSVIWELISSEPLSVLNPILATPFELSTNIQIQEVNVLYTYRITAVNNVGQVSSDITKIKCSLFLDIIPFLGKMFYISESAGVDCEYVGNCNIPAYHNGAGATPIFGDIVASDEEGTILLTDIFVCMSVTESPGVVSKLKTNEFGVSTDYECL
jgi:hypothetical protein